MKTAIVTLGEVRENKGVLNAKYYVNKSEGRNPYINKGGVLVEAKGGELSKAVYLNGAEFDVMSVLLKQKKIVDGGIKKFMDENT